METKLHITLRYILLFKEEQQEVLNACVWGLSLTLASWQKHCANGITANPCAFLTGPREIIFNFVSDFLINLDYVSLNLQSYPFIRGIWCMRYSFSALMAPY